jgi:Fe-S-cluster containining protein
MVKLSVQKGKLDLDEYSENTTLTALLEATESFVASHNVKSVRCRMCGECCSREPVLGLDMMLLAAREGVSVQDWAAAHLMEPVFPDLAAREKLIREFRAQTGMPELDAIKLYEYNQSEPLSFRQDENERCLYQKDNLCTNYANRPFICKLYLCGFGERLQALEEMIVAQGTWHAWSLLGAVPEVMIKHNPFIGAKSYDELLLKDFEFKPDGAEELFFYF